MSKEYVDVAVNLPPVRGTFHYHLPPEYLDRIHPGHLVTVPFGKRLVQGLVLENLATSEVQPTLPIQELLDPHPVLTPYQMKLGRWLAAYYHSPLIDCLTLMLPPGLSQKADSLYSLIDPAHPSDSPAQNRLIALLKKRGPLRGRQIERALSRVPWRSAADHLVRKGVLQRVSVLDPPSVRPKRIRTARLALSPEQLEALQPSLGKPGGEAAARRAAILHTLVQEREPLDITWVYAETGANPSDLRYLEERDLIILGGQEVWRDPLTEFEYVPAEPPELTPDQERVWEAVGRLFSTADLKGEAALLHGVTGSGKTELYLRAAAEALRLGKTAIVLVPEIALTPQTLRRFLSRFPGQVGVIHSQLSVGERFDTWRRARSGLISLVVGPRSALFAPLPNLGLIVLDESHDDSYKEQGGAPRYHARETALAYSRLARCVCLLGTATPDLTTYHRATRGELHLFHLPNRILGHRERIQEQSRRLGVTHRYQPAEGDAQSIEMPRVHVVDMRVELKAGNRSIFSRALLKALETVLLDKQQAILFMNRRGTHTHVFCRDCGHVLRCSRCDTPLTFHQDSGRLECHHCGHSRAASQACPECRSSRIRQFGTGTERIQSEIEALFPDAQTIRWDRDTTRSKGAHEIILAHFAAHRADLLIGTQMVAKGLDLPLVTLVGVVSADVGLHLPDFRSTERTFQVLAQVAGRAGRGLLGGQVILQTYHPENYAIRRAADHDYEGFFKEELRNRRDLHYPPFTRLVKLVYHHVIEDAAEAEALRMAGVLRGRLEDHTGPPVEILGPVPPFYARIRGDHRRQIVLRGADPVQLVPEEIQEGWQLDIDPVSLL